MVSKSSQKIHAALGDAHSDVPDAVTVSENVLEEVADAASVTVTVNVVAPMADVGVPLSRPELALKLSPAGNVPPERPNVYGVVPPLAVTGATDIAELTEPFTLGTACVVERGGLAAFTVSWNVFDDVAPTASVTVTVNVVAANVAVGMPLTWPVVALKLTPAGSVPPLIANVYGTVPPLAVTGENAASAVFTVPVLLATACVVVSAALTVRLNVFDEVALAASVTVTVNVVVASATVGVPLTCPELVLKLIPVGRVPPLRAKPYGVVPPVTVTGVNAAIAVLTVPVRLATACVVVSGAAAGLTVSPKVFDDVAPAASVAVTVKVVAVSGVVGVPTTCPFVVLNVSPFGSVPPLSANMYGVVPPPAVTGVNAPIAVFTVPVVFGTD